MIVRHSHHGRVAFVAGLFLCAAVAGGLTAGSEQTHASRSVLHWNAIAAKAFLPTQGTDPLAQSRTFAVLHAAVHNAANAIDPRFAPYGAGPQVDGTASLDAAVAAASRHVLVALIPAQRALIDDAYGLELSRIPDNLAKAAGIKLGEASARAVLARREHDGSDPASQSAYEPKAAAGEYQFTPPFNAAFFTAWGKVVPFGIDVPQHRLRGPYALTSAKYAADFIEVKEIGGTRSATRTAEQSEIAKFWYEDSPLGWNRIAAAAIEGAGLDAHGAARVLALVNFAMADGFVAGFEGKYHFRFWRPITAIRGASTDGNSSTEPDASWEPLMVTPPVPDYPSTHTVLGAAAAEVLIASFGDSMPFTATSLTLPDVSRRFRGFSEAATQNGLSRIYAGIHFRRAVTDGYQLGRDVGRKVAKMLPRL
jgi:hypothetical protein